MANLRACPYETVNETVIQAGPTELLGVRSSAKQPKRANILPVLTN